MQEVTVTPGELLADTDADLIHSTMGASEKDEEEAIRKAVECSTTARRQQYQIVDWSSLPREARFWDWKLGAAKVHYLLWSAGWGGRVSAGGLPRPHSPKNRT